MNTLSKLSFVTVACLLTCSCSKDKDLYNPGQGYTEAELATINANYEKFNTTTTMDVTVPSGKYEVVRIGTDTLCVATESQSVVVPKGITPTIDEYTLPSSSRTEVGYFNPLSGSKDGSYAREKYWQVIAFEDTKNGDYDYNDLIIHIRYQLTTKGVFSLFIHPVAYGATKTINLFYEVYYKSDNTLITSGSIMNTKKNLFLDDSSGFINTGSYTRHYDGYTASVENIATSVTNLSKLSIVWYITTNNDPNTKIYALSKSLINKADLFDSTGYPYSLVLSGVNPDGYPIAGTNNKCGYDWFKYPLETIDIRKCYDMSSWLSNNGTDNGVALEKYMLNSGANTLDVTTKESVSGRAIYDIPAPIKNVSLWTGK